MSYSIDTPFVYQQMYALVKDTKYARVFEDAIATSDPKWSFQLFNIHYDDEPSEHLKHHIRDLGVSYQELEELSKSNKVSVSDIVINLFRKAFDEKMFAADRYHKNNELAESLVNQKKEFNKIVKNIRFELR